MAFKKTKIYFVSLILLAGLIWSAIWRMPDGKLHLIFCDVGQGDAILISYQSTQVLIDGGSDSQVLACLSDNLPFWDRQIELVVLTHPEKDHLAGLIDVIERYNVKQFVLNSVINDTAYFWQFRQLVLVEAVPIFLLQAGEKIKIGSLSFEVLWPRPANGGGDSLAWSHSAEASRDRVLGAASPPQKINETSIVLKLSFGTFDAFLSGDIGFDTEKQLLSTPGALHPGVEVLKVAHHGSKYSSSEEFLEKVNPELAVISVGRNSFGHPTEEVLDRLANLGIQTLRTDKQGEVEIISDGKNWQIKP